MPIIPRKTDLTPTKSDPLSVQPTLVGSTGTGIAPTCPEIHEDGVTELYVPTDKGKIVADICFVHGLKGHPRKTWQYDKEFRCYWPFDFVSRDFPDVRVLTYGYDSHPTRYYKGVTNQMNVTQHSQKLLEQVTNSRVSNRGRPIIFVAHSLGGILVKDALVESLKCSDERKDLGSSCFGIFFFGTPHQGSEAAKHGKTATNLVSSFRGTLSTEQRILSALEPDSEKLSSVNRDFSELLDKKLIRIYNFQEGKGLTPVKGLDKKIVSSSSSFFNRRGAERSFVVPENHMDICRLKSSDTSPYKDFRAVFAGYLESIHKESTVKEEAQLEEERRALIRYLDFNEREDRENHIQRLRAPEASFKWVWSSPFARWLKDGAVKSPLFWISGKPGSGKSTLVDHIARSPETLDFLNESTNKSWKRIHFFFDFRAGRGVGNDFDSFSRSLLVQLLDEIPGLYAHLVTFCRIEKENPSDSTSKTLNVTLPIGSIARALESSLLALSTPLLVFLDGLDEYEGNKVDLISFIKQISSETTKICIACRPEPPFSVAFETLPSFAMQSLNLSGIRAFAIDKMEACFKDSKAYKNMIQSLAEDVADLSEGVFLWAHFATHELIDGITNGLESNSKALKKRLEQVPHELEQIYSRIFAKSSPNTRKWAGVALLLLCNSHQRHLPLVTLQEALTLIPESLVKFDTAHEDIVLETREYNLEVLKTKLLASTGGILESYQADNRWDGTPSSRAQEFLAVRLIHRTVQTYLDNTGWSASFGYRIDASLGHEIWVQICIRRWLEELSAFKLDSHYKARHQTFESANSNELSVSSIIDSMRQLARVPRHVDDQTLSHEEKWLLAYTLVNLPAHASSFEQISGMSSRNLLEPLEFSNYMEGHKLFTTLSLGPRHCGCGLGWYADDDHFLVNNPIIYSCVGMAISHSLYHFIQEYIAQGSIAKQKRESTHRRTTNNNTWNSKIRSFFKSSSDADITLLAMRKALAHYSILWESPEGMQILKLVLEHCGVVEDDDILLAIVSGSPEILELFLSFRPPGKLTLKVRGDTLRYFYYDGLKMKDLQCGLLFGLANRKVYDEHEMTKDSQRIIDILFSREEKMNEICGPFGTVLHCTIYASLKKLRVTFRRDPEDFINWLVRNGADIHQEGPQGNALEMVWKISQSRSGDDDSKGEMPFAYFVDRSMRLIEFFIEHGGVNNRPDPDGLVPSKEKMLRFGQDGLHHPPELRVPR